MGARLYNPASGRFLQPDPIEGGNANSYEYCSGDPINKVDLDGMDSAWKFLRTEWHISTGWREYGTGRFGHTAKNFFAAFLALYCYGCVILDNYQSQYREKYKVYYKNVCEKRDCWYEYKKMRTHKYQVHYRAHYIIGWGAKKGWTKGSPWEDCNAICLGSGGL
jgi:hypothetical protein